MKLFYSIIVIFLVERTLSVVMEEVQIMEGGSYHLDDPYADDGLDTLTGPIDLLSIASSCFSTLHVPEYDLFTICPFRNATFGQINQRRSRMSDDESLDESLAGTYKGWGKSITTQLKGSGGNVENDNEGEGEGVVGTGTGDHNEILTLLQTFDSGSYCRMGEQYSATVEFECTDDDKEAEEVGEEVYEKNDHDHNGDSDTVYKNDFEIKSVRLGSFERKASYGGSVLSHWNDDNDGCTFRVTLRVPFSCKLSAPLQDIQTLLEQPDVLKAKIFAEETQTEDEETDTETGLSELIKAWESYDVKLSDLLVNANPNPNTQRGSILEDDISSGTDIDIDSDTSEGNTELELDTKKSSDSDDISKGSCSCCLELEKLKLQLRAMAETMAEAACDVE